MLLNCQVLIEKLIQINRNICFAENELKKLKTFNSSCFIGKSHFEEDGAQNYSLFQPMYRYFKIFAGVGNGSYWQSKGLFNERINFITVSNYSVAPFLDYYDAKTRVESNGSYLKQYKIMYTLYTIYEKL